MMGVHNREGNPEMDTSCECRTCDGKCGGTTDPGSCGPLAERDEWMYCQACRAQIDVADDELTGAVATVTDGRVKLTVDVWNTFGKASIRLDSASARHLAVVLIERAAELDRERAS